MKKLTKEEFYQRVNNIHNNKYIHLNDFTTTRNNVTEICPIHGEFTIQAKKLLNGHGCSICGKEYAKVCHKNNWQAFLDKAYIKFGKDNFSFPNIKTEYANKDSIISMECNRCHNIRRISAAYILSNRCPSKCSDCASYIAYNELVGCNTTDNKIIEYAGLKPLNKGTVSMICPIHGEYKVKISTIIDGRGKCKKCSGYSKKLSYSQILERIDTKYGKDIITPLSEYKGSQEDMLFQCNKGHQFHRSLNCLLYGNLHHPCAICSKEELDKNKTKTTEEFKEEFYKIFNKEDYDLSETIYTKYSEPVTVKCNICGEYVTKTPELFLKGYGCNNHGKRFISHMENDIETLLKENNIKYIKQYSPAWLNNKFLDFYLPDYNIGIECQGLQHFKSIEYFGGDKDFINRQRRDKDKLNECNTHNVKLLYYADYNFDFPYTIITDKNILLKEILTYKTL